MSGIYTGVGRVIAVEFKHIESINNCVLELSVSITTGEKKKEGDTYPPSNIFKVPLWGKYAEAMQPYVTEGSYVYVSGLLVLEAYISGQSGEAKAKAIIKDAKIELVGKKSDSNFIEDNTEQSSPSVKESVVKASTKQKEAKAAVSKGIEEISFD